MLPNHKNLRTNWQIFLIFVLIIYMFGWNYSTAAAASYYVDNTNLSCTDAGPGTLGTPFCTIGHAAGIAVAGDTVHVLAGTYAETVNGANSGSAGLPITYSASPGVTVTGNGLTTGGNAFRMSGKSYIVVDGFTITGTADYGIYVFGSNNITLTNNHVSASGSPSSGLTRPGIYLNSTTDSTITGNAVDYNSSHGIHLTSGSDNNLVSDNIMFGNAQEYQRAANGIYIDNSSNNTILHNTIYGNEDSGVTNFTGSSGNLIIGNLVYGNGDHGIDFNNASNGVVVGNTVYGNVTSGINFAGTSNGATVANNIMADNGLLQEVGGGTVVGQSGNLRFDATSLVGSTLDYNIYHLSSGSVQIGWGATGYATLAAFQTGVSGQEVNGLEVDPLFASPASVAQRPTAAPWNVTVNVGDYHLTSGSPAIDSADSGAASEPTTDIEGNSRVDDPFTIDSGAGTRTYDDRGAYEFQPTPGAALPAITTLPVTSIGATAATGNGNITDLGVPDPTQHGVVWSTLANPTVSDNKTEDGPVSTTGAFTSSITGLVPGTLYHVRAYAWNAAGISYGEDVTFTASYSDYYVDKTDPSCSDAGPGTLGTPFCTIGQAAGIAVAGQTIYVLAGTYAETVNGANSGSAGLPITYSASPGVTVTGNAGNGFTMSGRGYIVVTGFTVTGTTGYGIYTFGSNNITLLNNHVSYSGSPLSGSTRVGIYINSTTNSTISGNTSDHNSNHGILLTNGSINNLISDNIVFGNAQGYQRDASGIRLDGGSSNNTILHNTIYGNEDSGVTNYSGSSGNRIIGNLTYGNGDHGIDNLDSPNNTVVGNTVHGNVTAGINFEGTSTGSGGATVINNIMFDNGLRQLVGGGTSGGQPSNLRFDPTSLVGNTLNYNLFYLSSAGDQIQWNDVDYPSLAAFRTVQPTQEANGLEANPNFVSPAPVAQRPASAPYSVTVNVGDYHLVTGSPAIDSANSNASNEPLLDIEGNARVDDPATANSGAGTRAYDDRGAYEFQPTIGTAVPTVTTQAVTAIATTTATGNGTLTDLGVPNPTAYGVVWGTALNPTTADNVSNLGAAGATGAFTAPITGLTPGVLYHVRAFATNSVNTVYGADVTFTALLVPTVTTQAVTAIVGTTATGNGNLTNLGVPNPTAYGVVWSTALNPTIADNVSNLGAAAATGTFAAPITGLTPGTLYHVRAFATNDAGTSYGADVTFTADQNVLTVTADDQTITYGDADPAFTFTYSGFVGTDTAADIDTAPTCTVAGAHSDAGSYTITCSGGVDNNYTFSYVDGTLTVNQATLTVTADDQTITYGDADPVFTFTYSGFVGTDTAADIDTAPTCTVVGAHSDAGSYTITCSGGVDNNYTFSYVGGTLTVNQATLTVTADDQTINYGDADPVFSFTYSGFVGTDTAADIDTAPTCTVVGAHSDAGSYTITCSGGVDNNYTFSYVGGTLTVNQATLTVTADDQTITYGDADPAFTFTYSGFVGTDTAADIDTAPTCTVAGAHSDAGSYTITCSGGVDNNYTFSYVDGTLTVVGITVTPSITANDKVYDGTVAATFTCSLTGVLAGDDVNCTGGTASFDNENVGTGKLVTATGLTLSGANAGSYSLSSASATDNADITPLTLNVTATGINKVYDGTATATVTLFDDRIAGDDLTVAYTTAAFLDPDVSIGKTVNVSGLSISSGADAGNYTLGNTAAMTTADITARTVSVTPDDAGKVYGDPDPAPLTTGTLTDFIPADGITATYTRVAGEVVGTYTINATLSPAGALSNYNITYNTATFTISAAAPIISWSDPAAIIYGTPLSDTQLNATALIPGVFTYIPPTGTVLNTGNNQNLHVDFVPDDTTNYSNATADVKINVNKATLNVVADDQFIDYGNPDPVFTFTYSGFVGIDSAGDIGTPPTCTVSVPHTKVGTYPIVCSGGVDDNYTFDYGDGTLSVGLASQTITVTTSAPSGPLSPKSTFTVVATTSSGLPVTYSSSGACTNVGATFTLNFDSPGVCTVLYSQPGNSNFAPASQVTETTEVILAIEGDVIRFDDGPSGDGYLSDQEITTVDIIELFVNYNRDVFNPDGDTATDDVTNPANYILVMDNGDGIQTSACNVGVIGNDVKIPVNAVFYDNNGGKGPFVATLKVNNGIPLSAGHYRLIVCGTTSVVDLDGIPIAGDGVHIGTDFIMDFSVVDQALKVPETGFPQGQVTMLPAQSGNKVYAATDLWLEIPKLGVKMSIVGVPQTRSGWDTTWLGNNAGWLNGSAFPTLQGNSVITGHVWDAFNNPGLFANLKDLVYGDQVKIHAYGQVFTYEVRERLLISPTNTSAMLKHKEQTWITLITCEDYKELTQSYAYRRMVRAVLVSVTEER